MKRRPRIYYTDSQKALMWERWRKGETLQQIAKLFDRYHPSIHGILAERAGYARRATPFQFGIDLERARGDLAWRGGGTSIRSIAAGSNEPHRPLAARSGAMVARKAIAPARPIERLGIGLSPEGL